MAGIVVLHGPNLNLLGRREPEVYGRATLAEIDAQLAELAAARGHQLSCLQSNAEHVLIDRVHAALGGVITLTGSEPVPGAAET